MIETEVARIVSGSADVPTSQDSLLIDMTEAARIMRVSVDSARSIVHRNPAALPTTRIGGRRRFLKRGDLIKFLQVRSVR